mmetsp:Transcript_243/g.480  ORF Transcript_243/g.480 Transcript_243/m.480 type:complete len:229 (-) Transcript_243:179-865(-)
MESTKILKTATVVAAGVVGAGLIAWPVSVWALVRNLEKPNFVVLQSLASSRSRWWYGPWRETIEIREYQPYVVAETEVKTTGLRTGLASGFREIAGYIFGRNTSLRAPTDQACEKIAMTAPVAAELCENNTYKISFMMPSKYSLETLPRPTSSQVEVKCVQGRRLAAITWFGSSPGEQKVRQMREKLDCVLAERSSFGCQSTSRTLLWQYHPPFSPSWMRRNEVLCEI